MMSPFFLDYNCQLFCTGQVDQSSRHRTGDRGWIEGGELRLGKHASGPEFRKEDFDIYIFMFDMVSGF